MYDDFLYDIQADELSYGFYNPFSDFYSPLSEPYDPYDALDNYPDYDA